MFHFIGFFFLIIIAVIAIGIAIVIAVVRALFGHRQTISFHTYRQTASDDSTSKRIDPQNVQENKPRKKIFEEDEGEYVEFEEVKE